MRDAGKKNDVVNFGSDAPGLLSRR
jgi:hypothetical protein